MAIRAPDGANKETEFGKMNAALNIFHSLVPITYSNSPQIKPVPK